LNYVAIITQPLAILSSASKYRQSKKILVHIFNFNSVLLFASISTHLLYLQSLKATDHNVYCIVAQGTFLC